MATAAETLAFVAIGAREAFVAHFRACIAELACQGHVEPECEALDDGGQLVAEGLLDVPIRFDAALIAEDRTETFMFESAELVQFESFTVALGGATVQAWPFHWDSCPIRLEPSLTPASLTPLRDWYLRWFRASATPEGGIVAAVHSLTDPQPSPTDTRLVVDLGTAPPEAFTEMLAACGASGARVVTIGEPV